MLKKSAVAATQLQVAVRSSELLQHCLGKNFMQAVGLLLAIKWIKYLQLENVDFEDLFGFIPYSTKLGLISLIAVKLV